MPYKKGESGNPNGRPRKERALTSLVEKALNKTILRDGKRVARKRILAEMLAQGITEGRVTFMQDGNKVVLTPDDWTQYMDKVIRILGHIDGPPPQEHELSGTINILGLDTVLTGVYGQANDDDPGG